MMADSDRTWRNLPPDDPRFKTWQLIRGVLQRNESQARADCIANYEANGLQSALLTLVEQQFDSFGQTVVMLVTNVTSAEKTAQCLNEALELTLDYYAPWFQEMEQRFRIPSHVLARESRIRLFARMEHWKAEAFQRGIEGELRAQTDGATDAPVRMEAETQQGTAVNGANDNRIDRHALIDRFLLKCKQETPLKATRTHIWRAAGHKSPRQFQFWQASNPKATAQDDQNFRRILEMSPTEFEALLKKKGLI